MGVALRQSEWLIGPIMELLEIDLPVLDHSTLSRRACGLPVQNPLTRRYIHRDIRFEIGGAFDQTYIR